MVHFVIGDTLLRASRGDDLLIRENPEVSLMGRIFAALGGTAFLAAAIFFWQMPVEDTGQDVTWIRIILCGGMAAMGVLLGWSGLYPRKSVTQLEMDMRKRELVISKVKVDRETEGSPSTQHTVAFANITQFFSGSRATAGNQQRGGGTCLYIEADGGPRNGAVLVGSVIEIEELARELNTLLQTAPDSVTTGLESPLQPRSGRFGRRGL